MTTLPSRPVQLLTAPSPHATDPGEVVLTALLEDGRIYQRVWDGDALDFGWREVPGFAPAVPAVMCARCDGEVAEPGTGGLCAACVAEVAAEMNAIVTPAGDVLVTASEHGAAA